MIPRRSVVVFDILDDLAAHTARSARELSHVAEQPLDPHKLPLHDEGEQVAGLMHQLTERLSHAVQLPIDSEGIHHLATELSQIVKAIEALAERRQLVHEPLVPGKLQQQIEVLVQTADAVQAAVHRLRESHRYGDLAPMLAEIHRLKAMGEGYHDAALARIFDGSAPPLEVLKSGELHHLTESAIGLCDQVADTLERIAVKSA